MAKVQKIPKWFKGTIYEEGARVYNQFSGESYELNNIELSIYDFIMGSVQVFNMQDPLNIDKEFIKSLKKGLSWFKKNNLKAYMVLLD
jgi:hypothetical protein|tara:strand:- start:210 stop:473 length:264 start_codon:yes stop_codon:yes gene_type:complete